MASQLKHDWVPDHSKLAFDPKNLNFSPKVKYLRLGKKTIENPDLKARYDSHFRLIIDYEDDSFLDVDEDAYALPEGAKNEVVLLVTRQQMEAKGVKLTCFPKRSPVMLFGGELMSKGLFSV